jgi:hypothetical protein
LLRAGTAVGAENASRTIRKEQVAKWMTELSNRPQPIGQEMTLDAGSHAMDLYTIWHHGSIITHIDALCH